MRKNYWLLYGFIFVAQCLLAQDRKQYSFTHYGVKDGLAAYNTTSIVQDDKGYIWIGTINGLQRFDGSRFVTFKLVSADTASISDNNVVQLMMDKKHRLWMMLGDGKIGIFDTKHFRFKPAKVIVSNNHFLKTERRLSEDSEGNISCVFLNYEVVTYNEQNKTFSAAYNVFKAPVNWKITCVTEDVVSKKYWISCDSGMAIYNKRTGALSYHNHNVEQEPFIETHGNISSLGNYNIDRQRRIWFLHWPPTVHDPVIYCYDIQHNKAVLDAYDIVRLIKKYIEPNAFIQQKDGTIWLKGINVFAKYIEDTKEFQLVNNDYINEQSIYYESVNALFEDREQNVWVGTSNNGIYLFNPSSQLFNSVKHTNRTTQKQGDATVLSFAYTASGNILSATWGDGIYSYDNNFNNIDSHIHGKNMPQEEMAWSMCRMKDEKTILLTGHPGFITMYNEETNTTKRYTPAILQGKTVRQIAEDTLGNIWLGTHSIGAYKWTAAKAVKKFEDGLQKLTTISDSRIERITVDPKGFVWMGCANEGLYKINPINDSILEHITNVGPRSKKLLSNDVVDVLYYNDTTMVIAAGGLNIYNTKANTIHHITTVDGLPSDMVISLEKDNSGYLWMGLSSGLCRMNMVKKTFTYYDRNDGIADDNFMQAASFHLPDGRLLFGSEEDFVYFNPAEALSGLEPPDVTITDFKLFDASLSLDSLEKLPAIELSHAQNALTIGFSSLSYVAKNKIAYYYMMDGLDKEWKRSELNQAVYNYLPPGNYTFNVKAENADGMAGKKITRLNLKINPPFWRSWWFIGIIILLAGCLAYWLDRERIARKLALQKVRIDIGDNLHEQINTGLSNINILSELARMKTTREPEKSISYIQQIHEKSHNMITAMDDMLWSISPENDSMVKTVQRMKEYTDALKNNHATQIDILVDKKVEKLSLHMRFRHEAYLLFKDVMTPLMHTGAKDFRIHIGLEKNNLIYTMQFDNGGADMQQLNNVLQNRTLAKRVQEINGSLKMQLHETHSAVTLYIPLKVV